MINFDTLNNKIVSASINSSKPVVNNLPVSKAENKKTAEINKEENYNGKKWLIGATAVAAAAIAGIAIYKGSKSKAVKEAINETVKDVIEQTADNSGNKIPNSKEPIKEGIAGIIQAKVRLNSELVIKAKAAYETMASKPEELARRIAALVLPTDGHVPLIGQRFTREQSKAVLKYMQEPSFNYYLRLAAEESPYKAEVSVFDNMIKSSPTLEEEVYVYRGLRTKDPSNNYEIEDFAKEFKEGFIIENKGYTSTCRKYNDLLGSYDPMNIEASERCGFMMRIKLPKGTQGIDARRFTGKKDLINGANGEFILPRDSKIKIIKIDEANNILDCEYVL